MSLLPDAIAGRRTRRPKSQTIGGPVRTRADSGVGTLARRVAAGRDSAHRGLGGMEPRRTTLDGWYRGESMLLEPSGWRLVPCIGDEPSGWRLVPCIGD